MYNADRWVDLDSGESSMIKALGVKHGYLIVQFHKGQVYRYPNGESYFDELLAAKSIGKYFIVNVRPLGGQRLGDEWPSH